MAMSDDLAAGFLERLRLGCCVVRFDGTAWHTVAANAHLRLMLGQPVETPVGQVTPFARERFADGQACDEFFARLRAVGVLIDHLVRLRRDDGSTTWVEVTAGITPDETDPTQRRLEAVCRDVGERRALDDQSRALQDELRQAEKLAALGHTISGVAHELNNPLATILSWAERLSALPGDERMRRGLGVILSESERAARIVRQLLTVARKRQSTRGLVDVTRIARESLTLRAHDLRLQNIQVIDALAAGLPPVFADGHQLKQVLLNLIINAEQAMRNAHGRGVLVVRSWHAPAEGLVLVEVSDDGPGVPPEVEGRIFDPFFTTKDVGQGTGLGLSVAYTLMREHGGRLRVASPASGGASFVMEVPAAAGAASADLIGGAGRTAAPTPPQPLTGTRVLVIEDEPQLATAVAETLIDEGCVVDRAGDGAEGLARIAEASYDVVICDLKMPRVGGRQFYRAMAAAMPALARRVIFVTGDVVGTEAERFLDETACRWLSKPFRLTDMVRAVRDTLG
jgi:signal transduction histidine kinase/CheY-like chemotaxis protein